ncbi:MAG: L,D-transpeptidase family protein [Verrucomicrobiae bacterium]|nr:L,D-transpeptidase family protein [Verrucomicrobiae bacterium]
MNFRSCPIPLLALATLAASCLSSCETNPSYHEQLHNPNSDYYNRRWDGQRRYDYPGSSASRNATINEDVLARTNSSNSRIEIDLGAQKARLYGGSELAIETQISTGREGHNTPSGNFSVLEKLPEKKSTLYGSWVDGSTGALLQGDGDSRSRPSGGVSPEFQGAPMPYWLRVTKDGVGMHVGYVPNYPASHGCIRVPRRIQPLIYERVKVGTPVTIRH